MAKEGRDVISVCCMKNDAGNIVSDADGMKNIWRKYMEKLLNVENDWDGEVYFPEVMGPHCLISEEEVAAAIKRLKIGKAAGPSGVVSEMMKANSRSPNCLFTTHMQTSSEFRKPSSPLKPKTQNT